MELRLQFSDGGVIHKPAACQGLVALIAESVKPEQPLVSRISLDVGDAFLIQTVAADHSLESGQVGWSEGKMENGRWWAQGVREEIRPVAGTHAPESQSLEDRWIDRFDEQIRFSIGEYFQRVQKTYPVFNRAKFPVI